MKIALIGPGILPIPPQGWGGTENYLWNLKNCLVALGHEVTIFNTTDLTSVARDVNAGNFDFVHLHYDQYVHFFVRHLKVPFCSTSHFGYIEKKDWWSRGFYSIYKDLFSSPGIVAISDRIARQFIRDGYEGILYTTKVGGDVKNQVFKKQGNGRALVLGKIEPRKRQAWLAKNLDGLVPIDFAGPIVDPAFVAGSTTHYLGSWSRDDVREKLTDYSVLALMSNGEAAPAVVSEALGAGCSLFLSEAASANLDRGKPFISVVPDMIEDRDLVAKELLSQIQNNAGYRDAIRAYAEEEFDQMNVTARYVEFAAEFQKKTADGHWKVYPVAWNVRYFFSRLYVASRNVQWLGGFWSVLKKMRAHVLNA